MVCSEKWMRWASAFDLAYETKSERKSRPARVGSPPWKPNDALSDPSCRALSMRAWAVEVLIMP